MQLVQHGVLSFAPSQISSFLLIPIDKRLTLTGKRSRSVKGIPDEKQGLLSSPVVLRTGAQEIHQGLATIKDNKVAGQQLLPPLACPASTRSEVRVVWMVEVERDWPQVIVGVDEPEKLWL
jgi:hypothetical protein